MRALARAFRAAEYRVLDRPAFSVRWNRVSPGLLRLMRAHGVAGASMLTAHNPGGRRRSAAANRAAQRRLLQSLRRLKPRALMAGLNLDPRGRWPDEPSVWVFGLSRLLVQALARRHGQAALLHCGPSGRPKLYWTERRSA